MRTPVTWIEKVVGVFVVVVVALLVAALFAAARRQHLFQLTRPFEIYAFLTEGYDLKVSAPVILNGVEAGVVTAVKLTTESERDPRHFDRMVRVTIRVERDFTEFLSVKTRALIERPPIGPPRVVLISDPRDRAAGKLELGAYITADVEESIQQKLAGIKKDVEAVKEDVIKTLRDLQAIIANVKKSTDAIAEGTGPVGRAIHDRAMADDVAASLAAARAALEDLRVVAANAKEATAPVADATAEARALVADVRKGVQAVNEGLASLPVIVASMERTLRDVEVLVRNLRDASGGLPEVVRKADRGLEETNRTIEAAQRSFLLRGNLPERAPLATEAEALPRGASR